MTYLQAARLACRIASCYLLFWVIADLISLPAELITLHHDWDLFRLAPGALGPNYEKDVVYFFRLAVIHLATNVLEIALWSALALWFVHFGPKLRGLLDVSEQVESTET